LTHDIERAFQEGRKPPKPEDEVDWSDPDYSQWHGERSADFTIKKLQDFGINDNLLSDKVKRLIVFHESGGDRETDSIKDADSLSFLEVNTGFFISRISTEDKRFNKQSIRKKFDWMFKRISSEKAKELARPFYKKAISGLEKSK